MGESRIETRGRKARAKLKLTASEAVALRCKLDKRKAKTCKGTYKTSKLKLGENKVKVTATDRAGNRSSKKKKLNVVRH
ncbi:hypothetical protein BH10ACT11_BH10ACT11_18410 [soil metagenome]